MEEPYCRICTNDGIFIDIFKSQDCSKYSEQIIKCLPIKVSENDELSCKVCHKCSFKLQLCSELIDQFKGLNNQIQEPSDTFCFVCSKNEGIIFEVKEGTSKYADIIVNLQNFTHEVHINNSVPKRICHGCAFRLETLHDLRQLSLESEDKLLRMRNCRTRTQHSSISEEVSSTSISDLSDGSEATKSRKVTPASKFTEKSPAIEEQESSSWITAKKVTPATEFSEKSPFIEEQESSPQIIAPLISIVKVEDTMDTVENTNVRSRRLNLRNKGVSICSPTTATSKETVTSTTATSKVTEESQVFQPDRSLQKSSASLPVVRLIPLNVFKKSGNACLNDDFNLKVNEKSQERMESEEMTVDLLANVKKEPDVLSEEISGSNTATSLHFTRGCGSSELARSSSLVNVANNTCVSRSTHPKQEVVASRHTVNRVSNTKKQRITSNHIFNEFTIKEEDMFDRNGASNSDLKTCINCGMDYSALHTNSSVCSTCTYRQCEANASQTLHKTCRVHLVNIDKIFGDFDMDTTYFVSSDSRTGKVREVTPITEKRKRDSNVPEINEIDQPVKRTRHESLNKDCSVEHEKVSTRRSVPKLKLKLHDGVHKVVDIAIEKRTPKIVPKTFKEELDINESQPEKVKLKATSTISAANESQRNMRSSTGTSSSTNNDFEGSKSVEEHKVRVIKHKRMPITITGTQNIKNKLNESEPKRKIISRRKVLRHNAIDSLEEESMDRRKIVLKQVHAGIKVKAKYSLTRKGEQNVEVLPKAAKSYKLETVNNEDNFSNSNSVQYILNEQSTDFINTASYTCGICGNVFPSNVQQKSHELTHSNKRLKLIIEKYVPIDSNHTDLSTSKCKATADTSSYESGTHNILHNGLVFIPDEIVRGEILINETCSSNFSGSAVSAEICESSLELKDSENCIPESSSGDVCKEAATSSENITRNNFETVMEDAEKKPVDELNIEADIHARDLVKTSADSEFTTALLESSEDYATSGKEESCIKDEVSEEGSTIEISKEDISKRDLVKTSADSEFTTALVENNEDYATSGKEESCIKDKVSEEGSTVVISKEDISKRDLVKTSADSEFTTALVENSEDYATSGKEESCIKDKVREEGSTVEISKEDISKGFTEEKNEEATHIQMTIDTDDENNVSNENEFDKNTSGMSDQNDDKSFNPSVEIGVDQSKILQLSAESSTLDKDQAFREEIGNDIQNSDGLDIAGVVVENLMEKVFEVCAQNSCETELSEETHKKVSLNTVTCNVSEDSEVSDNFNEEVSNCTLSSIQESVGIITLKDNEEIVTDAKEENCSAHSSGNKDHTEVTLEQNVCAESNTADSGNHCDSNDEDEKTADCEAVFAGNDNVHDNFNTTETNIVNTGLETTPDQEDEEEESSDVHNEIGENSAFGSDDLDSKLVDSHKVNEQVDGENSNNDARENIVTALQDKLEEYLEPISDDETGFD